MPPKGDRSSATDQFSITLPVQAIEMLEELAELGLHGSSRGEVARTLILSRLEQLVAQNIVRARKRRAPTAS